MLGAFFGDATEFNLTSETAPGVVRHYTSFNDAAEEAGDARPKVMFTADAGMRGGKPILYKDLVDEAIGLSQHPPHKVVIVP